jgi:hypothetical protein
MKKSIDSMNAVCREMSNLKPDAFMVLDLVIGTRRSVRVYGLSYEAKEGFTVNALRFALRAPKKEGGPPYLKHGVDDLGSADLLLMRTFPDRDFLYGICYQHQGVRCEYGICLVLDKKKAYAIARKQRTKRP